MKKLFTFAFCMLASFIPGIFGRMFSPSSGSNIWYDSLQKSILTPDGWVFGVAWTILYILLGVALFLAINNSKKSENKSYLILLFATHMLLNGLWSWIFFGIHLINVGLLVIAALIPVAILLQRAFAKRNKIAGYLALPYVIWLVFAFYLNLVIAIK